MFIGRVNFYFEEMLMKIRDGVQSYETFSCTMRDGVFALNFLRTKLQQ